MTFLRPFGYAGPGCLRWRSGCCVTIWHGRAPVKRAAALHGGLSDCGIFLAGGGGFLWLGLAQFFSAGPRYDAMLHSIFLGFVFSMIFAHAPIILPTITGLALPFQNAFYLHAGLLHLSLLLRIAGDLGLSFSLQQWGGLVNALAILLFLINNIRAVKVGAVATSSSG